MAELKDHERAHSGKPGSTVDHGQKGPLKFKASLEDRETMNLHPATDGHNVEVHGVNSKSHFKRLLKDGSTMWKHEAKGGVDKLSPAPEHELQAFWKGGGDKDTIYNPGDSYHIKDK